MFKHNEYTVTSSLLSCKDLHACENSRLFTVAVSRQYHVRHNCKDVKGSVHVIGYRLILFSKISI